jgi:hypothetical protein
MKRIMWFSEFRLPGVGVGVGDEPEPRPAQPANVRESARRGNNRALKPDFIGYSGALPFAGTSKRQNLKLRYCCPIRGCPELLGSPVSL